MRFKIDHKQWTRHAARVDAARRGAHDTFQDVVRGVAYSVRADWRAQWGPSRHLPKIGRSITIDMHLAGPVYTAEIGPQKGIGLQGSLGHLIEDANGAARNRATHAGNSAGRRAEPRFVRAVGEAGEDGIGG